MAGQKVQNGRLGGQDLQGGSFVSLELDFDADEFAWAKHGGWGALKKKNGTSRSIPNYFGARASRLYQMLQEGHHDVKLTDQELCRITLWLDCNSVYYGNYL